MKKLSAILFVSFFLLSQNFSAPQEKPKQEVTVIAVEVPVRVLQKGQVVKDLNKEDFEVFENGIKQETTAFEVVSRRISFAQEIPQEIKAPPKNRIFILIFNIFDYTEPVGEAIDYFFQNIFRPHDQLIILTEDRILNIERGNSISDVILNLKETLKKYKAISTFSTWRAYKELSQEGDSLLSELRGLSEQSHGDWDRAILRFYENYQRIWLEYKRQYITPDFELYKGIIKRIKPMEGEKWAICLQQREMFPKLKNEGPIESEIRRITESKIDPQDQVKVREIQVRQYELQRTFDLTSNFPVDRLRELFMEANATFHLILLKSFRTLLAQDFELGEVAEDYEDCFRQISFSTGGSSTFSNKVLEALKEAAVKEDFHYLLVYSPEDTSAQKERKIEVKVKKEGTEVIYLKHFIGKEPPPIIITGFQSGFKTIKFSLRNYARVKTEGKVHGFADVKITIFDDKSKKVFSEGKTLELIKEEILISLNFDKLKSGSYFIIIEAFDRMSNGKDVFSSAIKL
jgi:hypothetical protein